MALAALTATHCQTCNGKVTTDSDYHRQHSACGPVCPRHRLPDAVSSLRGRGRHVADPAAGIRLFLAYAEPPPERDWLSLSNFKLMTVTGNFAGDESPPRLCFVTLVRRVARAFIKRNVTSGNLCARDISREI